MEIVASQTSVLVHEVLERNNYERWSIFMWHYLVGQDLWDVVRLNWMPTGRDMREWIKKNALALYTIKISCGQEMFNEIKYLDSAKDAWDTLAEVHEPPVVSHESAGHPLERQTGPSRNHASLQYQILINAISNGNLLLARKQVRENENLLTIPDDDGKIPVELACGTNTIQEDLTRYLYRQTPLQSLNVDNIGFYILQQCLTRKMFDIAFDLLNRRPQLARHSCSSDSTPLILSLAQTQPPFFGRSILPFWERRIYDCIRVKAHVIKEDKRLYVEMILQDSFQTCREMIQQCFEPCAKTIQELFQKIGETIQAMKEEMKREIREEETIPERKFIVILLERLVRFIIGLSLLVLFTLISLIVSAVAITLLVLLILGKLILVPLRKLVSMFPTFYETPLYKIKLMDEYAREIVRLICQPLSNLDQNQFVHSRAEEATIQAIENGIADIVKEIRKAKANISRSSTDPEDSRSTIQKIFALAVKHRQEEVAHLLYESEKETDKLFTTDEDGNNTLHLAAKLPPNYQFGYYRAAAMQMQSEISWLRAVKEIVPRAYREAKNKDGETHVEVFVREHKQLLEEAEKWVKKTAASSTVVGALIITIMFAVAFTAPGGNDESTGLPVLLHKAPTPFMIVMVSDAISLFTATSSVVTFLGILTSHHPDEDYHKSLLLIIGLTSLFVSLATMTTAFCAALFIMLQGQGGLGLVIPITLLAGIPIVCYVWVEFPPLAQIMYLTFCLNIFGKKGTSWMSGRTADMIAWGMRGLRRAVKILAMCGNGSERARRIPT